MAILNILEFPDPRLRTIAKPVTAVDARIQQLVDDMFETMYDAPGIGLAATQGYTSGSSSLICPRTGPSHAYSSIPSWSH